MKKIYSRIKAFFSLLLFLSNSTYSFKDKIGIYIFLFSTYFKSLFSAENKIVTQKIFGYKVSSYGYKNLQYLFKEIFLSGEYFFSFPNNSPKILDCGSNIGMSILYFKKLYPDSTILAFEPNPNAFKLLKMNVEQNNLSNVQLFNVGLSNEESELDFFMDSNKGTLVGSIHKTRGGDNKITVNCKKLSSYIGTSHFDLLKMDIEGAEMGVLQDLITENKLKQSDRYIIEYHHKIHGARSEFSKFISPFEKNDFEYSIRTNFNELGNFQDVLLNIYKDEV